MAIQDVTSWNDLLAARARVDLGGDLAGILSLGNATDVIAFSGGFPDPATFPGPELADILGRLIQERDTSAFQYTGTKGLPSFVDYLRERLHRLEAMEPADDEVVVTSGGIEGLELLSKSYLDPGDAVVVEAPTYLGAVMSFRSFQADLLGVPTDDQGLQVEVIEDVLRDRGRAEPKLLYTIPDYQNPAGLRMAEERRHSLVELARRRGFLLIEDVAYRELGFRGDRLPSLWALAPDVVVQVGTFSKTFCPGTRLGWAVGPREVIGQMVVAKQLTDQCASPLGQRLVEEYGRRGLLDAGIERARALYGRRAEIMCSSLERHMPEGVSWVRPDGGFFCWVTLPPSLNAGALAVSAMDRGVAYVPGSSFYADRGGHNTLRLAFSRTEDTDIDEGIRRLADVFGAALSP